jgi:hypothetical protein
LVPFLRLQIPPFAGPLTFSKGREKLYLLRSFLLLSLPPAQLH